VISCVNNYKQIREKYSLTQGVEVEEQQKEAYAVYYDLCRQALAQYFHKDPDRNWHYVD
jgi:hypothetical protein